MKILFVAPRFHTNQADIVRCLKQRGHELRFLVSLHGRCEDHSLLKPSILAESGLSRAIRWMVGDGGVNKRRFFPTVSSLLDEIGRFRPDVAIIRVHGAVFAYMVAGISRFYGCKIVFYEQLDPETLKRLFAGRRKGLLRKIKFSGRLRLFSAAWMTPLPRGPDATGDLPEHCFFVPFSVAVDDRRRTANRVPSFLVVAKFQPRKNHVVMVEAMAQLAQGFEFRVTFVGEVSTPEHREVRERLNREVRSFGLESSVTVFENAAYQEMKDIYRDHDVYVLPASREPASISVLEAMGSGLPVICSDSCGTRRYVREGRNGFVFLSDDAISLASKMRIFLEQPGTIEQMSDEALRYAQERVSGAEFYRRFAFMLASRFGLKL